MRLIHSLGMYESPEPRGAQSVCLARIKRVHSSHLNILFQSPQHQALKAILLLVPCHLQRPILDTRMSPYQPSNLDGKIKLTSDRPVEHCCSGGYGDVLTGAYVEEGGINRAVRLTNFSQ